MITPETVQNLPPECQECLRVKTYLDPGLKPSEVPAREAFDVEKFILECAQKLPHYLNPMEKRTACRRRYITEKREPVT